LPHRGTHPGGTDDGDDHDTQRPRDETYDHSLATITRREPLGVEAV
jgi:hypothetical protein